MLKCKYVRACVHYSSIIIRGIKNIKKKKKTASCGIQNVKQIMSLQRYKKGHHIHLIQYNKCTEFTHRVYLFGIKMFCTHQTDKRFHL